MWKKDKSKDAPAKEGRFLTNLSWEADQVLNANKERRFAWRLVFGLLVCVVALAGVIAFMLPLKKVVPTVVMVDKLTGENQVITLAQDYVRTSTLSDKHWVQRYVVAHERYVYRFVQWDYDTVRLMSEPKVWADYTPKFEGSESMDKRFKDDVEILPNILSITLTGNGLATVRYEVKTRDYRTTAPPVVSRRIATLRYEYKSRNLLLENEQEAIANPLGFTVTAYQTDPEMGGEAKGATP